MDLLRIASRVAVGPGPVSIDQHKCQIEDDGEIVEGVSVRDETWSEAQAVLTAAWDAGYRHPLIDDSVMFLKTRVQSEGAYDPTDLADALEWARGNWWLDDGGDQA